MLYYTLVARFVADSEWSKENGELVGMTIVKALVDDGQTLLSQEIDRADVPPTRLVSISIHKDESVPMKHSCPYCKCLMD